MSKTPQVWTPDFDMDSIPMDIFWSHVQRVRANMRTTYSGGVVWGKHNPNTSRCRCKACNKRREAAKV